MNQIVEWTPAAWLMHLSAGAIPKLDGGTMGGWTNTLCPTIARTVEKYVQLLLGPFPLHLWRWEVT